jgi:hypothetical protein
LEKPLILAFFVGHWRWRTGCGGVSGKPQAGHTCALEAVFALHWGQDAFAMGAFLFSE